MNINWEKDGSDRGLLKQISLNFLGWLRANHKNIAQDNSTLDKNQMELCHKTDIRYTGTINTFNLER